MASKTTPVGRQRWQTPAPQRLVHAPQDDANIAAPTLVIPRSAIAIWRDSPLSKEARALPCFSWHFRDVVWISKLANVVCSGWRHSTQSILIALRSWRWNCSSLNIAKPYIESSEHNFTTRFFYGLSSVSYILKCWGPASGRLSHSTKGRIEYTLVGEVSLITVHISWSIRNATNVCADRPDKILYHIEQLSAFNYSWLSENHSEFISIR